MIEWGVAVLGLPGHPELGDRHLVKPFPNGALVAVVDGLGHGKEAAVAAEIAIRTLEEHAHESVISLVDRCHGRLLQTRGVVMSLASFDAEDSTMTWLGLGNVAGLLHRVGPAGLPEYELLLLRGGVVGGQLPRLSTSVVPIARGDGLIFATDGVRSGFDLELTPTDPPKEIADRILAKYGKGTDDALVLVARYLG